MNRAAWCLLAVLLSTGAAQAQFLPFGAEELGHPLDEGRLSVRLRGMADLGLTVADENRELNLADFGGNLAGVTRDREGWTLETWGRLDETFSDYDDVWRGVPIRQRDRFDLEDAYFEAVYRKPGRRSIGITTTWIGYDADSRYGTDYRVRGPEISGFYNEVLGALSAAVGYKSVTDNEDLVSTDVFEIDHSSSTNVFTFAASYDFLGLQAAGQLNLESVTIEGKSRDPSGFHQDDYEWRRPTRRFRLSLLRPEGERLAYGLNLDLVRHDGSEEGRISWSDRFPANPGNVNFRALVPTFEEKERIWSLAARSHYGLTPTVRLAASAEYRDREIEVIDQPGGNFPGSRVASDTEVSSWRLGGGAGFVLMDYRLRLGVEAYGRGGGTTTRRERGTDEVDSQGAELRAGAEYLLARDLALRGGYVRGAYDSDVDRSYSLSVSNGLSLGLGYAPRGGLVALDAAFRYRREKQNQEGGENRKSEAADLAVSARFLF